MPTFKITLAYDGTDFVGWQRQAIGVSIQGLLEDALRRARRARGDRDGRRPHRCRRPRARAGRGVHARARAGAPTRWCARSTRTCPTPCASCRRTRCRRRSTRASTRASKTYRYRIWNGDVVSPFERRYAWHVPGALDVDAMAAAARLRRRHARFRGVSGGRQRRDARPSGRSSSRSRPDRDSSGTLDRSASPSPRSR